MRSTVVLPAILAALALMGGACASDDTAGSSDSADPVEAADPSGAAEPTDPEQSGAAVGEQADSIEMTDVATGEMQSLEDALTPTDGKPLLAWFWAPFCPTCKGEAPELDEFMAENADRVDMVGVGSRNDLEYAEDFLSDTGVSNFPLLWEESGQSWVENAVAAQPYMILFDADGEEVERWPGGASAAQLDDALANLS